MALWQTWTASPPDRSQNWSPPWRSWWFPATALPTTTWKSKRPTCQHHQLASTKPWRAGPSTPVGAVRADHRIYCFFLPLTHGDGFSAYAASGERVARTRETAARVPPRSRSDPAVLSSAPAQAGKKHTPGYFSIFVPHLLQYIKFSSSQSAADEGSALDRLIYRFGPFHSSSRMLPLALVLGAQFVRPVSRR